MEPWNTLSLLALEHNYVTIYVWKHVAQGNFITDCNNTKCEVIAVLLTVDGYGGGRGGRGDKVQGGELLNLNWFYLIKLSILASQKCSLDNFFFYNFNSKSRSQVIILVLTWN